MGTVSNRMFNNYIKTASEEYNTLHLVYIDTTIFLNTGVILELFHTSENVLHLRAKLNKITNGFVKTFAQYLIRNVGIPSGPAVNLFFNFLKTLFTFS